MVQYSNHSYYSQQLATLRFSTVKISLDTFYIVLNSQRKFRELACGRHWPLQEMLLPKNLKIYLDNLEIPFKETVFPEIFVHHIFLRSYNFKSNGIT